MSAWFAAALLVLAYVVPNRLPPWVSWHSEVFVFAAVALLVVALVWRRSAQQTGARGIALPKTAALFVGLLLVLCLQWASGRIAFVGDAVVVGLYLALMLFAVLLGYALPRDPAGGLRNLPVALPVALVLAAVLSCAVAWVQVLELGSGSQWITRMPGLRRPGGNLAQPNHLATLLLVAALVVWYGYESRRLAAGTAVLLLLFLFSGVVLSESRSAIVSTWAIALWWWYKRAATGSRVHAAWVVFFCVGLPVAMWAWPGLLGSLQADGVAQSVGGNRVSASPGTRALVWPVLWEAAWQRPWWGWGFGGVSAALHALADQAALLDNFTYAHNLGLDLLVWLGFPITVLVLVFTLAWGLVRLRQVRHRSDWFVLACVLPVVVHAMFEFPHAYAYFLAPACFALGMLEKSLGARQWVLGRLPVAASCAVFVAVSVWTVVEYVALEQDFRDARFEALHFSHSQTRTAPDQTVLLTQLAALNAATRLQPAAALDAATLDLLRKVAVRFPSPPNAMRYATALALRGDTAEAARQLRVVRALYGERVYRAIEADWQQSSEPALARFVWPQ
jgi:hypothetical protein